MQLQTTKKKGMLLNDYFVKIKKIPNNFSAAGNLISEEDLVLYMFSSVRIEFDHVLVKITSRSEIPYLQEVFTILLNQESRIYQLNSAVNVDMLNNIIASYAQGPGGKKTYFLKNSQPQHNSNNT